MRTWRGTLIWVLALTGVAYPVLWYRASTSDAYKEAERFVRAHSVTTEQLGAVTSTRLWWRGISMETVGDTGEAHLLVGVQGERAHGIASINLRKKGTWSVDHGSLRPEGGEEVPMAPTPAGAT